jgi:hypothetical protein
MWQGLHAADGRGRMPRMSEGKSSGSQTNKRVWRSRLSSHSGTLLVVGIILIGLLIAFSYGGFPSILLPTFLLLVVCIPVDLISVILKLTPNKEPEPVKPLKAVFFLGVFYLIVAWCWNAGLSIIEDPGVADKLLRKVEFPFSEASHVIVDSEGSIYVFSQFNCRVQKYSTDGRFQFGWFSGGGWKNIEMAIDESDFIYTYASDPYTSIVRQYDLNGDMTKKVSRSGRYGGWWRLKSGSVVWDPNTEKPEHYDQYNDVFKDGDLFPSTGTRKTGFRSADGTYYTLRRLWFLFPVVSVEGGLGKVEDYIMPNPLSLTFTFVFPGFLFYILALIMTWVFQKQSERLTKRCLVCILAAAAIFIVGAAAVVIGGSIVMAMANSLPESNPLHFWLVPLVVLPYWIVVGWTAFLVWGRLRRWFRNTRRGENKDE